MKDVLTIIENFDKGKINRDEVDEAIKSLDDKKIKKIQAKLKGDLHTLIGRFDKYFGEKNDVAYFCLWLIVIACESMPEADIYKHKNFLNKNFDEIIDKASKEKLEKIKSRLRKYEKKERIADIISKLTD